MSFSGNKDGQTKMVKTSEGKVELHHWEASTSQWKKIGDVVGSSGGTPSTSGKALHNGKVAYSIYLHLFSPFLSVHPCFLKKTY
jgi:hypothetical protein